MHICRLNLRFLGLAYSPKETRNGYGFKTSELFQCKKCGKLVYKNIQMHCHDLSDMYSKHIQQVRECGYRPIGELLKSVDEISA